MLRFAAKVPHLGDMQMTTGVVNDVPALIDYDRNEFAHFPFGHELIYNDSRPVGFQTEAQTATQPLHALAWQAIPFSARVRGAYRKRAPR
jgi:hypothetical protein